MELEKVVENVTVADQIIEVLDDLCKKFGVVIDWASDNVMPYLLELMSKIVNYRLFCSWVYFGIFLTLFIIGLLVLRKYFKYINIDDATLKKDKRFIPQWIYEYPLGTLITIVIFEIGFLFFMVVNIFNIGECYYFPEKAVFDFIKTYTLFHS